MSSENRAKITFDQLQTFLRSIGFDQPAKINNALAFHHPPTGTIVTLSIPSDGRSVRPADLLSVTMRLDSEGLVDDATLAHFKSGKLPKAS